MPSAPTSGHRPLAASESVDDAAFLEFVGQKVRDARSRRGMTRKMLAHEADVSERHLAQIELGEGNVSIILLKRITAALNIPMAEVFSAEKPNGAAEDALRRILAQIPERQLDAAAARLRQPLRHRRHRECNGHNAGGHVKRVRRGRICLLGNATPYIVTNAGDQDNDTDDVTLRYAIDQAVADNEIATITFDPSLAGDDDHAGRHRCRARPTCMATRRSSIDGADITIDGSAAPGLVISGGDMLRPFAVTSTASLTLEDLTVEDGLAQGFRRRRRVPVAAAAAVAARGWGARCTTTAAPSRRRGSRSRTTRPWGAPAGRGRR